MGGRGASSGGGGGGASSTQVQSVDRTAKQLVQEAGGSVQEVDGPIESMPGRFIPEYKVTLPKGTRSMTQNNAMSGLPESFHLLPSGELVTVYHGKLNTVHPALEDAYKAAVRKANP